MDNGSRMTRECHVRFCERLRVKLPGPTHLEVLRSLRVTFLPSQRYFFQLRTALVAGVAVSVRFAGAGAAVLGTIAALLVLQAIFNVFIRLMFHARATKFHSWPTCFTPRTRN